MNILIGADPEIFVKQNDSFISAYGMIEGDKKNPKPVRNGAVQVDGMALEFNIEPAANEEDFLYNIQDVMGQLQAMIPKGTEMALVPVAEFGSEYIEAQPEEARMLGCDGDFNAWTRTANNAPDVAMPFRTASGHVHVGWTQGKSIDDKGHLNMIEKAVKEFDCFLGLPSLLFDSDTKRREMYGKAGAFRPKSYGCEYRTLSNKWLTDTKLMSLVYRNVFAAIQSLSNGQPLHEKYPEVPSIINSSNVEAAKEILDREGINYAV